MPLLVPHPRPSDLGITQISFSQTVRAKHHTQTNICMNFMEAMLMVLLLWWRSYLTAALTIKAGQT